jgi:hypothetical protein
MNHRTKNRRTGESNTEELVACLGKSGEKGSGAQRANRLGAPCSQATMVNGLGRRKNQLRRRETRPDLTGSETKAWAWSPTRKSKTSSGTKINRKLRRPPNLGLECAAGEATGRQAAGVQRWPPTADGAIGGAAASDGRRMLMRQRREGRRPMSGSGRNLKF